MKLLLTAALFFLLQSGAATTFYISPAGSDINGNGSINNPWHSLFKATSAVTVPGSIIYVTAGTYIEIQQSSLAVGVSIEGEGNNSIIKSSLTADWTEILSLKSAVEGTNGNQHIRNLKFDGQHLSTYWAIRIIGRSKVEVDHITIIDFKSDGIFFDGKTDNTEGAPLIYAANNSFHDNIVKNCAAYNLSTGEYGRGALNIGGQENMLIYNNTITQNERPDGYNGWPIKYSLGGYLKGLKIFNNKIIKKPFAGLFGGDHGWDFSIELWHCMGGLEIYGNTFQGALDLVHVAKHNYSFGARIHDNTISQPQINSHYETGILFEKGVEAAVVENNIINNCSSGVEVFCEYNGGNAGGEPDLPYNPVIDLTIRNNQFTNISSYRGHGIFIDSGPFIDTDMHGVFIYNNTITASETGNPYWGISISGVQKASNIQINNNTIKNFGAACIFIDPASQIDSLSIEKNNLTGNGFANKPSFINGRPKNYIFRNNTLTNSVIFSFANLKMNFIRPFYYALKNTSPLKFIMFFALFFCIFFCAKENTYVYPLGLIAAAISILLNFEQDLLGEICISFYFIAMGLYGWTLWLKRDRRKHRIIRISTSGKKELILQFALFSISFLITFFSYRYFKNEFSIGTAPLTDAFVIASAFTGMWLTTQKKIESWYWWMAAALSAVILYYIENYLLICSIFCVLAVLALYGLYKWKKNAVISQKRS